MKKLTEYLTSAEVLEKYPELAQKFGWTSKGIGLFLKSHLLEGYYSGTLRKTMIKEESIKI